MRKGTIWGKRQHETKSVFIMTMSNLLCTNFSVSTLNISVYQSGLHYSHYIIHTHVTHYTKSPKWSLFPWLVTNLLVINKFLTLIAMYTTVVKGARRNFRIGKHNTDRAQKIKPRLFYPSTTPTFDLARIWCGRPWQCPR